MAVLCAICLVPARSLVDASGVTTWNEDPAPAHYRSPVATDPSVILSGLKDRGVRLDGLSPDKVRLRLKFCVKQGFISVRQAGVLREHLFGD